jgi:hypothetical protein
MHSTSQRHVNTLPAKKGKDGMIHRISVVVAAAAGLALVPALSHVLAAPVARSAPTMTLVAHQSTADGAACPTMTVSGEAPATDLRIRSSHPKGMLSPGTACSLNSATDTVGTRHRQSGSGCGRQCNHAYEVKQDGQGNEAYQVNLATQANQSNQADTEYPDGQSNHAYEVRQDGANNRAYQLNLANQTGNQANQAGHDGNQLNQAEHDGNQANQAGHDGNQANQAGHDGNQANQAEHDGNQLNQAVLLNPAHLLNLANQS